MSNLKTKTLDYIKSHPLMNYRDFKTKSGIKISPQYYLLLRKNVYSPENRINRKNGMYINLITLSLKEVPIEARNPIIKIIKAINIVQGTRLEILENLQFKNIEIRRAL